MNRWTGSHSFANSPASASASASGAASPATSGSNTPSAGRPQSPFNPNVKNQNQSQNSSNQQQQGGGSAGAFHAGPAPMVTLGAEEQAVNHDKILVSFIYTSVGFVLLIRGR